MGRSGPEPPQVENDCLEPLALELACDIAQLMRRASGQLADPHVRDRIGIGHPEVPLAGRLLAPARDRLPRVLAARDRVSSRLSPRLAAEP